MEHTRVQRDTLYVEVWQEPVSVLAEKYGISDVALAKIGRKLNVPLPPRGYWARVRSGYRDTKPALPKLAPGLPDHAIIAPVVNRLRQLPEPVQRQKAFEALPENQILRRSGVHTIHPMVATAKKIHSEHGQDRSREAGPDVRVSKGTKDRAFRFLSLLVYALEERGFRMEARSQQLGGWVIMAPDEPLRFSIEEQSRRVGSDLEPTVKLTFRINDYWTQGVRKSWSDGVRKSLEEQLNDIMPALVDIGFLVREKRLAMEQRMAAAEAHRRQVTQEEARRKQLEADLHRSQVAIQLRDLISRVQSQDATDSQTHQKLSLWTDWAARELTRIDPLGKGLASFLAHYDF
jgi:hypothetical protein